MISHDDIISLQRDKSPANRARITRKVALLFRDHNLVDNELYLSQQILEMACHDAAVLIRQVMAETLKECGHLPHNLALKLANDEADSMVAAPFIEASPVLTDHDLLTLSRSGGSARQEAIAGRGTVNTDISQVLAEKGNEKVVQALSKNKGAEISEDACHTMLDRFPAVQEIADNLSQRGEMPISVAERLIMQVSDSLKEEILQYNDVDSALVEKAIKHSREQVTLDVVARGVSSVDIERLVTHLHKSNRLTESVIARAACTGDMRFFEYALAQRSALPLTNVQKIVQEGGLQGLQKLCEKAKIQTGYIDLLQSAVETYFESVENSSVDPTSKQFGRIMLERLLTKMQGHNNSNIDSLIESLESGLDQVLTANR